MERQPTVRGDRTVVDWGRNLRKNRRFDPEAEEHRAGAQVLDSLYGRA